VSERTIEVPPIPDRPPADTASARRRDGAVNLVRQYPWVAVGIALLAASTLIVVWARTRPGFDPYGWLTWGYQTLHLNLDLGGAPSWKPLPYLFTVPYALTGHDALWLWMITSVAISLSGVIFAGRIAYRLTGDGPRYAPIAAAVFAGVALLGIEDYSHYVLSVQSDPMIVTFCLAAIDSHLSGRPRWAFAFGVLAALGRPEAWPFFALYTIWAWRAIPSMRKLIVAGVALVPAMWFGIPILSGNDPFVAGQIALKSPRALHGGKVVGTWHRFTELTYLPIQLAALLTIVVAAVRRNWRVVVLGVGAAAWVVVEIAFALHGWPALQRYMFEAAAVMIVLAGVAVGWALALAPRIGPGIPRWAGIPVVAILVGFSIPGAVHRVRVARTDLRHERDRTTELNLLQSTLTHLGGYKHVRDCGEPTATVAWTSALAWFTKLNVGFVGHRPEIERHKPYPVVLLTPITGGWSTVIWHLPASRQASCGGMNAKFLSSPAHPNGELVRQ
jgi:hypothetical protein